MQEILFIFKEILLGLVNLLPYILLSIIPSLALTKWLIKNDLLGAGTPSRSKQNNLS